MSPRAETEPAPRELVLASLGATAVAPDPSPPDGTSAAARPGLLERPGLIERGAAAGRRVRLGLLAPAGRTRLWMEALVVIWLCWVYDAISNLAPLRLHAALAHGEDALRLERALHLDPELALNHWLAAHHTLGLIASDYYDNAHFAVTLGLLGWLWYRRPDIYRPLRNILVLINVLGFIVFWLYPMAPPRMLAGLGFQDIVATTHAFGSWHTGALASAANQLAAMPSLHLAWATWCALVLWRLSARRSVRVMAVLYPCLTAVVVLATGNHYLTDVVAGVATTALAVLLVGAVERRRRGRHPVAHVTNLLRSL
jgi:hypothetical protein